MQSLRACKMCLWHTSEVPPPRFQVLETRVLLLNYWRFWYKWFEPSWSCKRNFWALSFMLSSRL